MKVLAVDTATEACSAALAVGDRILERWQRCERGHVEQLPGMVEALLTEAGLVPAQLDALVAGIGPGSFAGVRVGVAYAKGLALALERPVFGVSSLAMLAVQAAREHPDVAHWWAAIDARMGEVYLGLYATQPILAAVVAERVVAPAALPGSVTGSGAGAVGSGWAAHGRALAAALGSPQPILAAALPQAVDALALALPRLLAGEGFDAGRLAPSYLRERVALTLAEQRAAAGR
ncbi:MAG: tRNA (adenosine(37)-N6)-threonylcarbamoyltransferase complex dimerization subunit type 1 TsaB [Gammaproteobacteria bacterium]|nr:tRNA (adenosine(37)-N6)-threonylcarbamoyltransferase complex dimerization subunit type 1 TsaB [Gammaproteobacteria bacterium]